jgi:hypothetical protein
MEIVRTTNAQRIFTVSLLVFERVDFVTHSHIHVASGHANVYSHCELKSCLLVKIQCGSCVIDNS